MSAEERQRRLNALEDFERALLLAYLDGRVPEMVDEWFTPRRQASRAWVREAVVTHHAAETESGSAGG